MNNTFLDDKAIKKLDERATQFAQRKIKSNTTTDSTLFVFHLGKEQKYGLDFDEIKRIIPYQNIRSIPNLNPLFSGLIYYDTRFIPVINLNLLFHCNEDNDECHFMLLDHPILHYALTIGRVAEQLIYNKRDMVQTKNPLLCGLYHGDIAVINAAAILNLLETTPVHK